jgi:hypothetical protein
MTSPGPTVVGRFLQQQAEELARVWRVARVGSRPDVFPGLIDGVVERVFSRAGRLLRDGAPPGELWPGLIGLIRWPVEGASSELAQEWALVAEVAAAACESLGASPPVAAWLEEAIGACQAGMRELERGTEAPPGIVTAVLFSSHSTRHRAERETRGS